MGKMTHVGILETREGWFHSENESYGILIWPHGKLIHNMATRSRVHSLELKSVSDPDLLRDKAQCTSLNVKHIATNMSLQFLPNKGGVLQELYILPDYPIMATLAFSDQSQSFT